MLINNSILYYTKKSVQRLTHIYSYIGILIHLYNIMTLKLKLDFVRNIQFLGNSNKFNLNYIATKSSLSVVYEPCRRRSHRFVYRKALKN